MRIALLLFVSTLAFAGCESKAHKIATLQAQFNHAFAAYTNDCPAAGGSSGAARMLTG